MEKWRGLHGELFISVVMCAGLEKVLWLVSVLGRGVWERPTRQVHLNPHTYMVWMGHKELNWLGVPDEIESSAKYARPIKFLSSLTSSIWQIHIRAVLITHMRIRQNEKLQWTIFKVIFSVFLFELFFLFAFHSTSEYKKKTFLNSSKKSRVMFRAEMENVTSKMEMYGKFSEERTHGKR